MAAMVRSSAWWGSKSVDARTIVWPFFQSPGVKTWMVLLPAAAVCASLVQEFFSVPCRFRVPPISMIPRSLRSFPPNPPKSSSLTLSVSVIVALRVWGLASVPISSSPCTMTHSVVSSRSLLSAKLSLPLIVKLRSGGGETSRTTFISFSMLTTASLVGTFLSGQVAGSDQRFALAVEVFSCALRTAYPPRPKKAGTSNERNKRERFRIVKISVIDHVTLLSPARIEGRVARDNFTPIVGRTPADGFCVAQDLRDLGRAVR